MNCLAHKMTILLFIILISGCNQQQEDTAAMKQATKTAAESAPKTRLSLAEGGLDLIKLGITFQEASKILNDKHIQFTKYDSTKTPTFELVIKDINLNDVLVNRLSLRFDTPSSKLKELSIYANTREWQATMQAVSTLNNESTKIYGTPRKTNTLSPESYFRQYKNVEQDHSEWSKNVTLAYTKVAKNDDDYSAQLFIEVAPVSKLSAAEIEALKQPTSSLTKAGKRIKAKHPDWNDETCNVVGSGKINIGMTKEQVRTAWGRPYKVNTTTTAYGTREQWVIHEIGSTYVYFEDGICTAVQN